MKAAFGGFVILALLYGGPALAGPDDVKWIAKCVSDNADAKNVDAATVRKYCTCMNNKMDDNETLTVTAWEKTPVGKTALAACDKESGWDKK
jgi:hypothetical protein